MLDIASLTSTTATFVRPEGVDSSHCAAAPVRSNPLRESHVWACQNIPNLHATEDYVYLDPWFITLDKINTIGLLILPETAFKQICKSLWPLVENDSGY